jgi:hypothetical protein
MQVQEFLKSNLGSRLAPLRLRSGQSYGVHSFAAARLSVGASSRGWGS